MSAQCQVTGGADVGLYRHEPRSRFLGGLVCTALFVLLAPPATAANRLVLTEPGLELTTDPPGAEVAIAVLGHPCSEKAPPSAKPPTFVFVTPYSGPEDRLPRFQGSERRPKWCITYRFAVSRLNFHTTEEDVDGRDLKVARKHWVLERISPGAGAAASPVASVSIRAELDGESIDGAHFRYNEVRVAVVDFLTVLANQGLLSDYELDPPVSEEVSSRPLVISVRFSEREGRHLAKAFGKGFARGFFTLGLAPPGKGDYDFSSEAVIEIERAGARLGPYRASSKAVTKPEMKDYNDTAAAIRHDVTTAVLHEIRLQLEAAGVIPPSVS